VAASGDGRASPLRTVNHRALVFSRADCFAERTANASYLPNERRSPLRIILLVYRSAISSAMS
jgi:hypothetical protein